MIFAIIKIIHILASFAWMAGLLYLPRLFVYHTRASNNEQMNSTFKIMESKLFIYIIIPSMIIVWFSGLHMVIVDEFYKFALVHLKMMFVLVLTIFTFYLAGCLVKFKYNKNTHSEKFYRRINEVPFLLLIIIVTLIIIKDYLD